MKKQVFLNDRGEVVAADAEDTTRMIETEYDEHDRLIRGSVYYRRKKENERSG